MNRCLYMIDTDINRHFVILFNSIIIIKNIYFRHKGFEIYITANITYMVTTLDIIYIYIYYIKSPVLMNNYMIEKNHYKNHVLTNKKHKDGKCYTIQYITVLYC